MKLSEAPIGSILKTPFQYKGDNLEFIIRSHTYKEGVVMAYTRHILEILGSPETSAWTTDMSKASSVAVWLNSDKPAREWWDSTLGAAGKTLPPTVDNLITKGIDTGSYTYPVQDYYNQPGFLAQLPKALVDNLVECDILSNSDSYTFPCKIHLPDNSNSHSGEEAIKPGDAYEYTHPYVYSSLFKGLLFCDRITKEMGRPRAELRTNQEATILLRTAYNDNYAYKAHLTTTDSDTSWAYSYNTYGSCNRQACLKMIFHLNANMEIEHLGGPYFQVAGLEPTLSGQDTNLGEKTDPFSYSYRVTSISQSYKVKEYLNGVVSKQLDCSGDYEGSIDLSTNWTDVPIGLNELKVEVVESEGVKVTRVVIFSKKPEALTEPLPSGTATEKADSISKVSEHIGYNVTMAANELRDGYSNLI